MLQTSMTQYDGIGTISLDILQLAGDAPDFDDALNSWNTESFVTLAVATSFETIRDV